jgi:hypothetical protein
MNDVERADSCMNRQYSLCFIDHNISLSICFILFLVLVDPIIESKAGSLINCIAKSACSRRCKEVRVQSPCSCPCYYRYFHLENMMSSNMHVSLYVASYQLTTIAWDVVICDHRSGPVNYIFTTQITSRFSSVAPKNNTLIHTTSKHQFHQFRAADSSVGASRSIP